MQGFGLSRSAYSFQQAKPLKPPTKSSRSDTHIPSLSRQNSDSSSSRMTKAAKASLVRRASSRQSNGHSSRTSSRHSSPAPLNRRKSVVLDSAGRETGEVDSEDEEEWEEEDSVGVSGSRPKGASVRKTSERLGKSAKVHGGMSADMRRTMSDSQARPAVVLQPLTRTKSNVIVDDSAAAGAGAAARAGGRDRADSSTSTTTAATAGAEGSAHPPRPNTATRKTTGFTGTQTHPDPSASTPAHALNDPMHVMPAHQIKHQQSARSLHALTATTSASASAGPAPASSGTDDRVQRTRSQTGESRRSIGSIGPLSRPSSDKGRERRTKSPATTPGVSGAPSAHRQESALSIELSRNPTPAGSRNITPAPTPGPSSPVNKVVKVWDGGEARQKSRDRQRDAGAQQQQQQQQRGEADDGEESDVRVDASDALQSSARPQEPGPDESPSYPFPKVLPEAMGDAAGTETGKALSQSPDTVRRETSASQVPAQQQQQQYTAEQGQEGDAEDQASSEERKHTRSSRDPGGAGAAQAHVRRRSRDTERSPRRDRRSFPPGPSHLSAATKAPSTDTSSASTEPVSGTASRQASHNYARQQQHQYTDSGTGSAPRSRQVSGAPASSGQGQKTLKHRYSNSSIRSIQSLRAPPHPLNSPTGYRSHMAPATTSSGYTPTSAGYAGAGPSGLASPSRAKPPSMHYPPAAPPIINPEQAAGHAWEIPEDGEYRAEGSSESSGARRGMEGSAGSLRQSQSQTQDSGSKNKGKAPMARSGSFASVRSITNILSGVTVSSSSAHGQDNTHASSTTASGDSPRPNRRRTALEATSLASKYRTTSSAAEYHSSLGYPSTSAETAHLISRFLPPKKVKRPAWDISPEDMRSGNLPASGIGLTNGDYREAHESLVRTMRNLGVDGDGVHGASGGMGGLGLGRRGLSRSTSGLMGQGSGLSPLSRTGGDEGQTGQGQALGQGLGQGLGVVRSAQGSLTVAKGGWNGRTPFELSVDRCLAQRPTYRGVSGHVLGNAS